jgi:hypothetical protein|tara:strand:- start:794 stop:976 length:183 start_codon:yes stop_codon:yes gene_type:complete
MSINRSNISQEVNKPGNKKKFKNAKKMFTPKDKYIPQNNYKMMKPQNLDTQNLLKLLQNN